MIKKREAHQCVLKERRKKIKCEKITRIALNCITAVDFVVNGCIVYYDKNVFISSLKVLLSFIRLRGIRKYLNKKVIAAVEKMYGFKEKNLTLAKSDARYYMNKLA